MKNEKWKEFIAKVFRKNNKPYLATFGQVEIFSSILDPNIKYLWITAPTRYGKTEISAMAILVLATLFNLKIPIVGGTISKANKIMEYILEHISDNEFFYRGLINISLRDIEALKVMRSKTALRWKDGGWIYITSIEERLLSKGGENVVGEGGDVVFLEEAGLIKSEEQFSKIIRMPEGKIAKLIMSGNCFENSVFEKAYHNPVYYKIKISLDQAIEEGRIEKERLFNEIKPQMTSKDWKRFYELEFPKASDYAFFKPKKYDLLPKLDSLSIYGAVDLALGEKGSNLTAIVVLGRDKKSGQIYEIDTIAKIMTPDEAINTILNLPYNFVRFGIEEVSFQKYFSDVISRKSKEIGKYIPFTGINQSRQKLERIESLEPIINTGQILIKGSNELESELKDYPLCEYFDALDSLEMCYRLVSKSLVFAF